ncbi:UGT-49 protein, partial [Aphelenchoides avenae]
HFFIPEIDPKLNAVNGSAKAHRIIRLERPHARHGLAGMGIMMDPYAGFNNMLIDGTTKAFIQIYIDLCRDLLREDDLLEHLASEKYDVAITESLDVCAFGLFHLIGARTNIGSLAIPMGELARSLGIPSPSSFVP